MAVLKFHCRGWEIAPNIPAGETPIQDQTSSCPAEPRVGRLPASWGSGGTDGRRPFLCGQPRSPGREHRPCVLATGTHRALLMQETHSVERGKIRRRTRQRCRGRSQLRVGFLGSAWYSGKGSGVDRGMWAHETRGCHPFAPVSSPAAWGSCLLPPAPTHGAMRRRLQLNDLCIIKHCLHGGY